MRGESTTACLGPMSSISFPCQRYTSPNREAAVSVSDQGTIVSMHASKVKHHRYTIDV